MKLIGSDYLLLLLYLCGKKPIKGSVRLTKMMFLFEKQIAPAMKNIDINNLPEFFAYNYGPFSKDLYQQIELFKGIGFLRVIEQEIGEKDSINADDNVEREFIDECVENDNELVQSRVLSIYQITECGSGYVEEKIIPEVDEEQVKMLEHFKSKIIEISPEQLLYYVYSKYPEYTEKSLIREEVLKNDR